MMELQAIRQAMADVLRPGHFFAAPGLELQSTHLPAEETPWEVFRGQLAPRHLTREMRIFETFNLFVIQDGQRSAEPLLSLKLDAERGQIHMVRGLLCWIWEGYQEGENVYLSREVPRWIRELAGTLDLAACVTEESLREQLATWVFRAVVGMSRLPLTSVEAPLPGFSLGSLAFFRKEGSSQNAAPAMTSWPALLTRFCREWPDQVRTKWLEFLLRCVPAGEVGEAAAAWEQVWRDNGHSATEALALMRAVINEIALSPWTDFVNNTLAFLRHLVLRQFLTVQQQIDFLGWQLRQLARHLTAYDLITFHHRGANYPDALLLDAAVKEYLWLLEQQPTLFEGENRPARLRRRALSLAWLQRQRYEGHPVPDAPTSPGENMRILPPPHVRVPEEQILNLGKRKKRLYQGDPLPDHLGPHGQRILQECGRDLLQVDELRELGMAIFIERPLGAGKAPGEPDQSPLLAHKAFSRSLAERALSELARQPLFELSADDVAKGRTVLAQAWPTDGIAANKLPALPPRVVSLADATKAAGDFVILRTLPASVREFCMLPEVARMLAERAINIEDGSWLVVTNTFAGGKIGVLIRDAPGGQSLQIEMDAQQRLRLA